jgi:hypothetical protein
LVFEERGAHGPCLLFRVDLHGKGHQYASAAIISVKPGMIVPRMMANLSDSDNPPLLPCCEVDIPSDFELRAAVWVDLKINIIRAK